MSDPQIQSLRLSWRPELRFYEQRVAILTAFRGRRRAPSFPVQEDFVDARLFDSRDLVTVRRDGLELRLAAPGADPDLVWVAVEIALSSLQPRRPRMMEAFFKHLAPLEMEFDEAVEAAYGRVLGFRGSSTTRFGDWAMLVDAEVGESATGRFESTASCARREVLPRFTQHVGRIDTRPIGQGG